MEKTMKICILVRNELKEMYDTVIIKTHISALGVGSIIYYFDISSEHVKERVHYVFIGIRR